MRITGVCPKVPPVRSEGDESAWERPGEGPAEGRETAEPMRGGLLHGVVGPGSTGPVGASVVPEDDPGDVVVGARLSEVVSPHWSVV